jgi:signal transduction histidine kinase/ActR/RegA family two-component response regulator
MPVREKFIHRMLLPTGVGLIAVVLALAVMLRLLKQQSAEINAQTAAQAMFVKNKMESVLKARTLPLELLGRRWQIRQQLNAIEMDSDAALVMSGYPTYQALEWVDPTYRVRWVAPREANEVDLGTDLTSDGPRIEAMLTCAGSGGITVSRSVSLRQGGRGLLVCVPVRPDSNAGGFVVGVFRYQDLLDSILQDVAQDYWVAVYDGDDQIYIRTGATPPLAKAPAQQEAIEFWQLTWLAQVWPKVGKLGYAQSMLPQATFIGGILMAAWLAFTVYIAQTAKTRSENLEAEIAGREHAEEALRHAQKMEAVGRLAGGVAHDFNNLLMIIRGQATLSLRSYFPPEPLRSNLESILKAAERASSVTRQLLAFSRKQVLQPKVLDLNTLVTQVADLLPPMIGEDIRLVMILDPELGRVKADPGQVEQVLMNLAANARDAMPRGGELTLQTANVELDDTIKQRYPGPRLGSHVMLAVKDNGHGMDAETLSHAFEPFFTTKEKNKGTGLGLSTAYGIVEQSGGAISLRSEPGVGTTLTIYFPRTEAPLEEPAAPEIAAETLAGTETILVVEDDDAVRKMTCTFLTIKGYLVLEARNAAEAMKIAARGCDSIALLLTDVVMPGMKGREMVAQISRICDDLPVLYMSAYTEDAAINNGILDPGTAFIEKPFGPDDLAMKIREVLQSASRKQPHRAVPRTVKD